MTGKAPELGMGFTGSPYPAEGDLYRVFVEEYRKRYPEVTIMMICNYNPQRLLTDQRSELVKFVAGRVLGEPYEPVVTNPPYHSGGSVTGRFSGGRLSFPYLMPRDEEVRPLMRRREPTFKMPDIDYGQTEARIMRQHMEQIPKFTASIKIAAEGMDQFSAAMRKVQDQLRAYQERAILMALYAGYQPDPMFKREHRIATLLLSNDRRQRKRGERLFQQWRRTRPGINFNRYRKD